MWIPGWIPLPSPNDDDRSRDDDQKPGRPGDRGVPASDAPSEEDRSAFARLLRSGRERQDTSAKGETETAHAKAPEAKSRPESHEPDKWREDRHEPDKPREDRHEPDQRRPSSRVGPPAPEGRPDSGGNPELGYGRGSSGHDRGGHDHQGGESGQEPTPGMMILGALQGTAEPASIPAAASEDEDRLETVLREVVHAVWTTNPTARGQSAVRLEITEEMLPQTTIDLAMEDGELLVTITTGAPEVERFLADHLGELRDRLASRLRDRSVRVELARAGSLEAAGASPDRDRPVRPAGGQGQ
jgi:Type III secretion protein (HpaP)